jgi:hypothetical protein
MNTTYPNEKPGLFTAIAVMTLVSGIVNLFWGFVTSAAMLSTFIGVICVPFTILPTILGVFEIIYASKLLSSQPQNVTPSQPIAVFEILMLFYFNIFSVIAGILTLIFYNDQSVRDYFARINAVRVSTPAAAPEPVIESLPAPTPEILPASSEPVLSEPEISEPEISEPEIIEEPVKPKRTRKVAGK